MADEPKKVIGRPFQPGNPGRPKSSRNKLSESFLTAMARNFEEGGIEAIERVRQSDPSTYLRVIASLIPKEITGADGEALIPGIQVTFVGAKPEKT